MAAVFLRARNVKTQMQLWALELYQIKLNPGVESDVQDVCVTSMRVTNGQIEIMNEKGDTIVVDLSRRRVIGGAGRIYHYGMPTDGQPRLTGFAIAGILLVTLVVLVASMRWIFKTV
jgi:hypothetical protein